MKKNNPPLKNLELPKRLRSARFAAGHLTVSEIIDRIGVPESTYRAAEAGERNASTKLIEGAAKAFGVSYRYLVEGTVETDAEQKSKRVEEALRTISDPDMSMSAIATWLRLRRMEAGFKSASDAARTFSWSISSYIAHENGRRPIPPEKVALYAVHFDADLTKLIFSRSSAKSTSEAKVESDIAARRSNYTSSSSYSFEGRDESPTFWDHLARSHQIQGPTVTVPFVRATGERGYLTVDGNISLPLKILQRRDMFEAREAFCALVGGERDFGKWGERVIAIVQRWRGEAGQSLLVYDGREIRRALHSEEVVQGDPMSVVRHGDDPIVLGVQRGRIMIDV